MHRFLFALTWMSACSAISYERKVDRVAEQEIRAAARAGAAERAPYFFRLASQYLRVARDLAAHSDYGSAELFGNKAREAGVKARKVAAAKDSVR